MATTVKPRKSFATSVKAALGKALSPDEWRMHCRAWATAPHVQLSVAQVLRDPAHPAFAAVLKLVLAYGYGQPTQSVDVTSRGFHVVIQGGPVASLTADTTATVTVEEAP